MSTPFMWELLRENPALRCVKCGAGHKEIKNGVKRLLTKDHIVALANEGRDEMDNIQILCNVCNQLKAAFGQLSGIGE